MYSPQNYLNQVGDVVIPGSNQGATMNELLATVMSENCFLNCKFVVVTSRLAIFLRLTGVSKLFALTWKVDLRSKRSFTSIPEFELKTPPSATSETVPMPVTSAVYSGTSNETPTWDCAPRLYISFGLISEINLCKLLESAKSP